MNPAQARQLIKDTFTHAFDKARFREFAINLLNHVDEDKKGSWTSQYIKDAFKDHVQRYERLGTYISPDKQKLDVLIVHLTAESKLEHARRTARQNDPGGFVCSEFLRRRIKAHQLRIYVLFANSARYQLAVLRAEIQDRYPFAVFHGYLVLVLVVVLDSLRLQFREPRETRGKRGPFASLTEHELEHDHLTLHALFIISLKRLNR